MARSAHTPGPRGGVVGFLRENLEPRVAQWVTRNRRADLPSFVSALGATDPDELLAVPAARADAQRYLVRSWQTTVTLLARPESLPEVVQRRDRVRLHPVAPLTTATIAGLGGAYVAGADWALGWEVLGVGGVVLGTAALASGLWRPRARAKDRRFTLTGTAAVVARAEAEVATQGLLALGSGPSGIDEHLGQLVGASRLLEDLEREGHEAGLLCADGMLLRPAQTPADHALLDELMATRAELVHALVQLGSLGHSERAQQRSQERRAYRPRADPAP